MTTKKNTKSTAKSTPAAGAKTDSPKPSRTVAAAKVLRSILIFPTAISALYACYYAYTLLAMPISGEVAAIAYLAIILPLGALAAALFVVFSIVNLKKRSEELQKCAIHILICALVMLTWPILVFVAAMFIMLFSKLPLL